MFRAVDPDGDRIVAIKLFRLDWPPEQARALAGALETLIETLPAHPNIVMPLASGLEGGCAWLAQEFVGADSLEARLRRRTPVHAGEAVALMRQVAAGLDLSAAAGWRHGALHPRDILVDTAGRVHVTGVGVAQIVERFGARPHRRRPYTAPERAIAAGWDTRADVFALATIASEMLGPRRSRGQSDEARIAAFSEAGFNGRLAADVLNRGMSNIAGERPPTATALIDALEQTVGVPELEEDARLTAPDSETGPASLFDIPAENVPGPATETPGSRTADIEAAPALTAPSVVEAAGDAELPGGEPVAEPTVLEVARQDEPANGAAPLDDWDIARPSPLADVLDAADVREPEPERVPIDRLEWAEAPPRDVAAPSETTTGGAFSPAEATVTARETRLPLGLLAAVLLVGLVAGFGLGRWSASGAGRPASAVATSTPSTAPANVVDEPVIGEAEPARGTQPPAETTRTPATPTASVVPPRVTSSVPAQAPAPAPPAASRAPATSGAPGAQAGAGASGGPGPAGASPAPRQQAVSPPAPAKPVPAGRLLVRTSPAGARVKIDGKDRGVSPLTLRDLGLREYAVEITRSGYATETRRVRLTSRRSSQTVDVRLRPAPARGATPGAAPGGAPTPGAAAAPGAPVASPTGRASLELVTRPAGARVSVDGQFIGVTPLRLVDVAPGTKNVSFELAGHAKWSAVVTVAPGEPRKISASLEPLP